MRTARHYLAHEIYRSCTVVLLALLGLFTFFSLIEELDNLNGTFTMLALFYLQALAIPARLYDLLPIGLLIGSILALANLAQRNELIILRVSGVSHLKLIAMLWLITLPLMLGAAVLSEWLTPLAELKNSEVTLRLQGHSLGGRLESGYWFKEPTKDQGLRTINIATLYGDGKVEGITLYEFDKNLELLALSQAKRGYFSDNKLLMQNVVENRIAPDALISLQDARTPKTPLLTVHTLAKRELSTTLTPARLLARVLTPERMSLLTLLDYISYLNHNQLQTDRQVVAVWRKVMYPFTLIVMMTIAAPVAFMQTRRGGVGAKVFMGILLGVGFFMVNQLALNLGMLTRWPPWLTAILPSLGALLIAFFALILMEYRYPFARLFLQRWPWSRSP
jgi:lipopolysaccharide export system permease protein